MRKGSKKTKLGRPPWIPNENIINKARKFAARGMTEKQIAQSLGIRQTTLIEKKKAFSEFAEAIKKGQAEGIAIVTNALFNAASKGNIVAQIFYLKNRADWSDKQEIEQKHKGDIKVNVFHRVVSSNGHLPRLPPNAVRSIPEQN